MHYHNIDNNKLEAETKGHNLPYNNKEGNNCDQCIEDGYVSKISFYDILHNEDEDIEGLSCITDCDCESSVCYEGSIECLDCEEKPMDFDL